VPTAAMATLCAWYDSGGSGVVWWWELVPTVVVWSMRDVSACAAYGR
jgi:hypothetical protein